MYTSGEKRHRILMKLQEPRLPNLLKQGQQSSHPLSMKLITNQSCSSLQEREFSSQAMYNGHTHAQHWCEPFGFFSVDEFSRQFLATPVGLVELKTCNKK